MITYSCDRCGVKTTEPYPWVLELRRNGQIGDRTFNLCEEHLAELKAWLAGDARLERRTRHTHEHIHVE